MQIVVSAGDPVSASSEAKKEAAQLHPDRPVTDWVAEQVHIIRER